MNFSKILALGSSIFLKCFLLLTRVGSNIPLFSTTGGWFYKLGLSISTDHIWGGSKAGVLLSSSARPGLDSSSVIPPTIVHNWGWYYLSYSPLLTKGTQELDIHSAISCYWPGEGHNSVFRQWQGFLVSLQYFSDMETAILITVFKRSGISLDHCSLWEASASVEVSKIHPHVV